MGLGLALSLGGVAAAQQPGTDAPRGDRGGEQRGGRGEWGRGPMGGPRGLLFKDITLTEAQKTQVTALQKADHDKMEANRDQFSKERDQVRAAREKGDTAAVRAIMQRRRQAMEQNRDQQLASIRNILTSDQRAQFDKNIAELKQREAERGPRTGPKGERAHSGFGRSGQ